MYHDLDKKDWPYGIDTCMNQLSSKVSWCGDNLKFAAWKYGLNTPQFIYFKNLDDAIAFKIVWGDEILKGRT